MRRVLPPPEFAVSLARVPLADFSNEKGRVVSTCGIN